VPTPGRRPTPTETRRRALVNTRPHGIANKRTPQPGHATQPTQRPRRTDNSRPNHLNQDPSKLESSTLTSRERTCCAEKSTKSLENSKELCPRSSALAAMHGRRGPECRSIRPPAPSEGLPAILDLRALLDARVAVLACPGPYASCPFLSGASRMCSCSSSLPYRSLCVGERRETGSQRAPSSRLSS
jgi:hypothetical protein